MIIVRLQRTKNNYCGPAARWKHNHDWYSIIQTLWYTRNHRHTAVELWYHGTADVQNDPHTIADDRLPKLCQVTSGIPKAAVRLDALPIC